MFYHDHSYGITRLNVYAGEAAGYLLTDPVQEDALAKAGVPGNTGTLPDLNHLVPLVLQDKTFVPDNGAPGGQLAAEDPTWDVVKYGGAGNLWFPHVYTPNQNPADISGANAFGRWDYGAWFWPAQDPSTYVSQPFPCPSIFYSALNPPAFPPLLCPGFPNPSGTPEAFMDTPVINGAAYPTLTVDPTAYRFQILTAGNDRTWNLGLYVADPLSIAVTNPGSGYTTPPNVLISGGGGSGATAQALMSNGGVTGNLFTNVGSGYINPPNVAITGDGTGAAATASIAVAAPPATGYSLAAINITNPGSGYTHATITIDPPLGCVPSVTSVCTTAAATASVTPPGTVIGVKVTNPGAGYTSAPTVAFSGGNGSGAVAMASINSEVKMLDAAPHTASSPLPLCTNNPTAGGAQQAQAILDANGAPINGTGLQTGCWPSTWPTDGRDGGVPDPTTAGPAITQIATEGGVLPHPVVIPSTPLSYEYNRRSITVLNVYTHGLTMGPAERADIVIDFSKYAGKTLIVYNDAPAPVPAFDPRNDYYTGAPDNTFQGGAPGSLPGYGPNTRTIMQIKVNASGTGGSVVSSVTLTNGGSGYATPNVAITGGGGTGAQATAMGSVTGLAMINPGTGYISPTVTLAPAPGDTTGSGATASFSGALSGLTVTAPGAGYGSAPTLSFSGGGGSLAAGKATVSVTALPFTAGSGYKAAPTVTITDTAGAGTGATAKATVSITGLTYTGGAGYSAAPSITITDPTGTGSGATVTDTVSVTGFNVGNAGAGYTSAPSVGVADSLGGTGSGATGTATLKVTGIITTASGSGYNAAPTVNITDTVAGAGAAGKATVSVTGIITTSSGSGYNAAPAVTITDPTGSGAGALAKATVSVTGIITTTSGSGYVAPTVIISDTLGGTGSGATATATADPITGRITGLTLVTPGKGYTAPLVIISGGPGTGATAATTGAVDSLTLTAIGAKYTAPQVNFVGSNTTPAAATTTGVVDSVSIVSQGAGYTKPGVNLTGGGGSGATASVTGAVNAIALGVAGAGYRAPLVSLTGGGYTTQASANTTGAVDSVTLTTKLGRAIRLP